MIAPLPTPAKAAKRHKHVKHPKLPSTHHYRGRSYEVYFNQATNSFAYRLLDSPEPSENSQPSLNQTHKNARTLINHLQP